MSKIRIANWYTVVTRNDGNPLYMWRAFGKIPNVESGHFQPYPPIDGYGKWDFNFEADWGQDALTELLPGPTLDIPKPNAFWASDTHLGYQWRLDHARKFDHVFCAQKRGAEEFTRDGVPAIWLPHAVHTEAYFPQPSIKKYDVCFVGHVNSQNRVDALDRLFREFPNFWYGQRLFEEAAEKFCQSKIVFNISISDDINMRIFEVLATSSFLLTNELPTLGELFQDGVHLATYKNEQEMVDKARYYLEHDEERERIAEAGYQEVVSKHTHLHRAKTVLNHCLPGWNQPELEAVAAGIKSTGDLNG